MNGPQNYAKLSSAARKFLNTKIEIERPKVVQRYDYLGVGAYLPKTAAKEESEIHKFLSQTALSENVHEEFGKALDVLV